MIKFIPISHDGNTELTEEEKLQDTILERKVQKILLIVFVIEVIARLF